MGKEQDSSGGAVGDSLRSSVGGHTSVDEES